MSIQDNIVAWRRASLSARFDLDIDADSPGPAGPAGPTGPTGPAGADGTGGGDANTTFICDPSDFGTPSAGVYTLLDNQTYIVTCTVDLLGDRLVCGANTTIRGWSSENCRLKSTGLGATALITSVYTLPMLNLTIEADVALDLVAVDGNQALDWNGVNFTDCATVGRIEAYSNVIWVNCALLNSANLTFDGTIGTVGFNGCIFVGIAGQSTIILPATYVATRRFRIIYSAVVAFGGATGIQVNASATIPVESFILDTVAFSGGATYVSGITSDDNKSLWINNTGTANSASIAAMTMLGNSTVTTVAATDTPYKVLGTTTLDASRSQKFSMPANNRLTYDGAIQREFRCTGIITCIAGNNVQIRTWFAKNGTVIPESQTTSTTDGNGRRENVALQVIASLVDTDYIEVFVENTTGTQDITVEDLNVIIEALN